MRTADIAVLVVEDEPLIQMDAVDFLEDAGFKVYFSGTAREAIACLENFPDIRVVFTDINMPGDMDGLALSKSVRDRWPPVHIIVTSGKRFIGSAELPSDAVFIAKPYRHDRIVEQILQMAA